MTVLVITPYREKLLAASSATLCIHASWGGRIRTGNQRGLQTLAEYQRESINSYPLNIKKKK